MFNDINIRHKDTNGNSISEIKVPIAYGPIQKFLARIEQQPELNKPIAMTLPRLSYEMTSIQYDASRKANITQAFKACDGTDVKQVFLPVPYNIGFQLNLMSKLQTDALQVVEQILPFFQPSFNITIDLIDSIGEKRNVPIVLDSTAFTDDYEGDFNERRILIYTFNFTAKVFLFGPISNSTDGIIRKAQVDIYTSTDTQNATREMRYTVEPDPIDVNPGDSFGFDETWEYLPDSRNYSPTQQKDIS